MRGGGEEDAASVWTRSSRGSACRSRVASVASKRPETPPQKSIAVGNRKRVSSASPAALTSRSSTSKCLRAASVTSVSKASAWTHGDMREGSKAGTVASKSGKSCVVKSAEAAASVVPTGSRGQCTSSIADDATDIEEDMDVQPQRVRGGPKCLATYFNRGSSRNPALQEDGMFREQCSRCAYVIVANSAVNLSSKRWNHNSRWHPGLPRENGQGTTLAKVAELRVLGANESADWRCPLCDVGIPAGKRAACSRQAYLEGKDKRRRQAHRHLTREEYGRWHDHLHLAQDVEKEAQGEVEHLCGVQDCMAVPYMHWVLDLSWPCAEAQVPGA